jgi:hypothetical protein
MAARRASICPSDRYQPCIGCCRHLAVSNDRQIIANTVRVVPRRRGRANCRALSITCGKALSKMGLKRSFAGRPSSRGLPVASRLMQRPQASWRGLSGSLRYPPRSTR